ncbi:MAG: L-seryl-tRNA(Sec) selenium transferase [Anaerolineae bacterium]|nr:L-seryl-tRNA(Sec) selenium transferase [Anaerolineae bacterium]
MVQTELRKLPSVNTLLETQELLVLAEVHGHDLVVDAVRTELDLARRKIIAGKSSNTLSQLTQSITDRVISTTRPTLQSVINATGVIIHTNLGRALLSYRAQEAMVQAASAYSNLEYSLEAGERGSRYVHAAELLCRLTGAEAALVVNNNAAAVVLTLMALAQHKPVLISRSQLVEIGGGFRVPDIMAQSGAKLVEVGTTNRTYIRDYEQALDPESSGLILSVHHSNYQITGFTAQPSLAELADLAHQNAIPFMEDLGSGTLLDTSLFGLDHEPTIQESIAAGVDIVTASGDKLLGGPQAGLILGRADLIARLKKHPLTRALRVDKTTLAALQATLLAYLENKATLEIPVWRMIAAEVATLAQRASHWLTVLKNVPALSEIPLEVIDTVSTVGGGSLPGQTLPTKALAVMVASPDDLAERLRLPTANVLPVVARIEANRLILDPRTVLVEQDESLLDAVKSALLALTI